MVLENILIKIMKLNMGFGKTVNDKNGLILKNIILSTSHYLLLYQDNSYDCTEYTPDLTCIANQFLHHLDS